MTVVEFYDRTPIENAISMLTTAPSKIVFVGDGKEMARFRPSYEALLHQRAPHIEVEYRKVNPNKLNEIVDVLVDIVQREGECVFDLTGGDDLVLVAMGIVSERYAELPVRMQRFNVHSGRVTDCDNDGNVLYDGAPRLSADELVLLHGGRVRFEQNADGRTYRWDLSEDFVKDVDAMWQICRQNPGEWNVKVGVLARMSKLADGNPDALAVDVDLSAVRTKTEQEKDPYDDPCGLLRALAHRGLITNYAEGDGTVAFAYKNEQVKRALSTAGMALELKILTLAAAMTNADGTPFFTDCLNGVSIDWDGEFHAENDTENEIDVVLMRGMMPLFVSCKNGRIDEAELYKLSSVTDRFGGLYAKKQLIATYFGGRSPDDICRRAADMEVDVVGGAHQMTDEELALSLRRMFEV